ncbi:unnamed protein product [Rotaria socialis]|uniref:LicD/FKTN/FKRP nucleotidyltransferase domain-containing protein n=1 Tax=Rotaria socialis TaxID=392032 RepID=A0A820HL05_9BILA|nr:unnamed protein product [Rotaria socialis]CAF4294993.1 unnamed protein product [Rotaria socialis]
MKLFEYYNLKYIILFLFGYILINFLLSYKFFSLNNTYATEQQENWTPTMKKFCSKVQQNVKKEKPSRLSWLGNVQLQPPNFNKYFRKQSIEIPYLYSTWRSSPDLSRRLNPCDHQLYIELIRIFDHFLRRHQISYMIMDGTLLGSYTNHDFLPWDDDLDIRILLRDRSRMYTLLRQELENTVKILNITNQFGSYEILFFPWAPQAGDYHWSYPNIHIVYLEENSTHIWKQNSDNDSINDCSISKSDIFPVVWRPFGQIWLPAPREPLTVFELLRWKTFDKMFFAKNYSHKYEREIPLIDGRAQPSQLYPYYSWNRRREKKVNKTSYFENTEGAHIFIIEYAYMGTLCSSQIDCSSLFQRKSKPRIDNGRQIIEELSTINISDHISMNDNNVPTSSIDLAGEFVPERYLVLLTEQMVDMLFRLMIYNESRMLMSECDFDHQTTLRNSIVSGHTLSSSPNSPNRESPLQLQSMHQACIKCKKKMLTIEEFRELGH